MCISADEDVWGYMEKACTKHKKYDIFFWLNIIFRFTDAKILYTRELSLFVSDSSSIFNISVISRRILPVMNILKCER